MDKAVLMRQPAEIERDNTQFQNVCLHQDVHLCSESFQNSA